MLVRHVAIAAAILAVAGCHPHHRHHRVVVHHEAAHHGAAHHEAGPPAHAPAHGYRARHAYHYYPGAEVYFRVDTGTWFWLDGGDWKVAASLPGHLRSGLGAKVELDLEADHPRHAHAEVRRKHPGRGGPPAHAGGGGGKGEDDHPGRGRGRGGR